MDSFLASEGSLGIKSTNNISYISLSRLLEENSTKEYKCSNNSAIYFGSSFNISVYKSFTDYIIHLKNYTYNDNNITKIINLLKEGGLGNNLNQVIFYSLVNSCAKHINSSLNESSNLGKHLNTILDKILNDGLNGVVNLRKQTWESQGPLGVKFLGKRKHDFVYWMKNRLTELDYPLSQEFSAYIGIIADYHNSKDKNDFIRNKSALKFMRLRNTFLIRFLELKKLFLKKQRLNGINISKEHLQMINSIISFLSIFDYDNLVKTGFQFNDNDEAKGFKHFFNGCVNFNGFTESLQNMQLACMNSGLPFISWLEYLEKEENLKLLNDLVGNVSKLGMTTSLVIESCWKANKDTISETIDINNSNKDDNKIKKEVSGLYKHIQNKSKNVPGFTKKNFVGFKILKQENSTNTNVAKFTLGLRADIPTGTVSLKAGDTSLATVNILKIVEKTTDPATSLGIKSFRKILECLTEATLDFEVGMTNNEERSSQALVTIISDGDTINKYVRPTIIL